MAERVPVTIVTGFLGSGKTTLLRRLLAAESGVRTAALINDFGALGLDHELVAPVGDTIAPVIELSNGCVCCTINEDLQRALDTVLALDPRVQHVLIETTGVADPMPVVATLTRPDVRARVRVDGVVTLVDATAPLEEVLKTEAGSAQLAAADVLVINKVDLVSTVTLDKLESQFVVRKGSARLMKTSHAEVPLVAITGVGRFDLLVGFDHEHECGVDCEHDAFAHAHLARDGFRSISIRLESPLDPQRFQRFLWNDVPETIYRGKGLVRLGADGRPYVFHRVGARTTFDPWDRAIEHSRAVFIGRVTESEAEALKLALARCDLARTTR